MDEHVMTRRTGATWLARLMGRRYVLAWALSLAGATLHRALVPGASVDWQPWTMGVLAMSVGLLGLWWVEPYLWYRYRRRRFRRLLTAEGGWRPWSLHMPLRPWQPTKVGWRRRMRAVLSGMRRGGERPVARPAQEGSARPTSAGDQLGAPSAP